MDANLIGQAIAGASCLLILILWLALRSKTTANMSSTIKQLLWWYPMSAPWLLVRTPLLYALVEVGGIELWAAIIIEFVIERPLFFLTAREAANHVE